MFLMTLPDFTHPETWVSLLMITFLEIILGIDNIVFISIASNRLKKENRPLGRNVGLLLALVFRIALLFGITYVIAMQQSVFSVGLPFFKGQFNGQGLILIAGGLFLLYKSTTEIHHKLEGAESEASVDRVKKNSTLFNVIAQIALLNAVFSFDSILTAVGLTESVFIMIIAIVLSVIIMMIFAGPVSRLVNRHPTLQMLGLSFLLLIGFMLMAEGAHHSHVVIASQEIGSVPKGYLYFAITFSLIVEVLNMRLRKERSPVHLHNISKEMENGKW